VYEVLVNHGKQMGAITDRGPQNLQKVFAERPVEIQRVIFDTNAPPQAGGHRYLVWKPELEAQPPGEVFYDPPLQIVQHWDGYFGLRSEAPPLDRTYARTQLCTPCGDVMVCDGNVWRCKGCGYNRKVTSATPPLPPRISQHGPRAPPPFPPPAFTPPELVATSRKRPLSSDKKMLTSHSKSASPAMMPTAAKTSSHAKATAKGKKGSGKARQLSPDLWF